MVVVMVAMVMMIVAVTAAAARAMNMMMVVRMLVARRAGTGGHGGGAFQLVFNEIQDIAHLVPPCISAFSYYISGSPGFAKRYLLAAGIDETR